LQHQSLPRDEHVGDGAGVAPLEEVCRLEQLVVSDLKGSPHPVLVAAGGRVGERGVQGGQAVEVAAGGTGVEDAGVLSGTGVEDVGQMLHQQRGQGGRRHGDAQRNPAVQGGEGRRDQGENRDSAGGRPYG
jgi:hypothetical protein